MSKKGSYHFIGIGGIGMSALAQILLEKEQVVSGSDLFLSETVKQLQAKGAQIVTHHGKENIQAETAVIYGSAIPGDHPEIRAAEELLCPLLHRSELLAELIRGSKALAVAGTHGKSTTSALLASLLLHAQREVSFAIGAYLKEFGTNGRFGKDELFVIEADESDQSFLRYFPEGAIVTNVEEEHMSFYETKEKLHAAFTQFLSQVKNEKWLFYCGDDPTLVALAHRRGSSYGFSKECDLRIENYKQEGWRLSFDLHTPQATYTNIELPLVGRHNALNAAAVFGLGLCLGLSEEVIRLGLSAFKGIGRRCEKRFEDERIVLLDDYAHHPTEVRATLRAIKEAVAPRRVVAIFQPHRYSRTRDLLDEFAKAFCDADLLYLTEIYAASEKVIPGITSDLLQKEIEKGSRILVQKLSLDEIPTFQAQDVVVTLGAGSITYYNDKLAAHFSAGQGVRKLEVGFVFGGKSVEHEISRKSAANVISQLDPLLYEISYFGIDKQGHWQMGERAKEMLTSDQELSFKDRDLFFSDEMREAIDKLDLFFPVIHGPNGEDGTLQGLFEMLQKPYVGPNHRTAAVGMDKAMTKRLLQNASVPTPPFLTFDRAMWMKDQQLYLKTIEQSLTYPLYVKPLHLGSSIGITKVNRSSELLPALDKAFAFDGAVLVEQGIVGGRELEFAVLGNGSKCDVPPPGEKLAQGSFVDYEMKYSSKPVLTSVVAQVEPHLVEKGRSLALKAYLALAGSGMMRVDFLLDSQGNYWCFEVNPIPGMMKYSLYPKMWEAKGLPPKALFNHLIALGLSRAREIKR